LTQDEVDQMESAIGKFFRERTKAEFLKEAVERGMLGYPISSADDILADEQLKVRDFWQAIALPGRPEPVQFPGAFVQFSDMACGIQRRPPLLGEHTGEILTGELGFQEKQLGRLRAGRVI
jgi:formyl-CoA transferase